MVENNDEVEFKLENEQTKLYKNPLEKICELSTYNGYRTYYLEPGDGYNIGSFFAFPKDSTFGDYEEKSFREMIVRQNIDDKKYSNKRELIFETLPQFQKLIDDIKETNGLAFMPLLPTKENAEKDFQNLDKDAMEDTGKYYKIHKQISNAFDMARLQISRLTQKDVPEKWFLYGREKTSTGLFRLWSLCPEKTSAICCNSSIDNIVLPVIAHKSENMNYPEGFGNYKDITGIDGNNSEMLSQYRDTDVLYIGNSFDIEKQKHEEQVRAKLKKLKFPHINIERYDGTRIVDFSYFYQFRSEIYKETFLGKLLKKIGRKKEEILLLAPVPAQVSKETANVKPVSSNESEYFGQLSEAEMETYKANLVEAAQKPSRGIAKERLARVMTNAVSNNSAEKTIGE